MIVSGNLMSIAIHKSFCKSLAGIRQYIYLITF